MSTPDRIRILIVEDHVALAENLFEYFDPGKFVLDFAADGLTALHLLATNTYDVIVLDVMLPGVSGYEICRRIRADLKCNTPVIMMTAKDQMQDKEQGFSQGADDYLVKPFNLRELELRVLALDRRHRPHRESLQAGKLCFDPGTLEVSVEGGTHMTLSGGPARLLEVFMRAYPNIVTHEQLQEALGAHKEMDANTLRTHVYMLRKLLQQQFDDPMIKTVHGRGYRLLPPTA